MAKGKKQKKIKLTQEDLPEVVGEDVPDPFLTAFVGVFRYVDPDTGEMTNKIKAFGPNEEGLPEYIIAKGMLSVASEALGEMYQEYYAGTLGDEEY